MSILSRRQFLRSSAAYSLGFAGLHTLLGSTACVDPASAVEGFGALSVDPEGIMDLPDGFSYSILSRTGDAMDDGLIVPGAPDGMAAFEAPEGKTVIIRNHELTALDDSLGPFGLGNVLLGDFPAERFYDAGFGSTPSLGGTTTLLYDTASGVLEEQKLNLIGTLRNCAGGPTPWGTWISCEETVQRAGASHEQDHGYCFEVSADWSAPFSDPVPLRAMGRFNHEAVAVEPTTSIAYLTEDRDDGLLYRFLPISPGNFQAGGILQALAVRGAPGSDLRNWSEGTAFPVGTRFDVEWITLDIVEAPADDLRHRGFSAGAARFARGEGMWYGDGTATGEASAVYFVCTSGGYAQSGQVWRYVPSPNEGTLVESDQPGVLELFVEPNQRGLIDNADNLTVAPWGDLVLCEDGSGPQYLIGVTPEGELYKIGRNAVNHSELAGATFSPDGTTLFVNIQRPGITLAITGPWKA
jgi:hypothetical protein